MSSKPWAGRFKERTAKTVETFTSSVSFDSRLWKYDIEGSIAHAKMLGKQKIISSKETRSILKGLNRLKLKIQKGQFTFSDDMEDVHMNIEAALTRSIGAPGGKLHTARSRNDQVALDLRLYLRDEIKETVRLIDRLRKVFVRLAEKHIDAVMPGYTHLQRAQPVLLSHHLMAYFEMFTRDMDRFKDCLKRVNVLPLGSCALAGTTLPVDRKYVAKLLKFPAVSDNSIDAVSDRDFIVEFISTAGLLMTHIARLSEELVLWNTEEFGFIELPDAYSTGSSIMPQKKNPDVLELSRGKTGRVIGHLLSIFVVLKGLPLAYNRDLQEDKEPLFDTVDTVKACLSVLTEMMPRVRFNKKAMRKAAEGGFSTATDLAEYLVRKGVPFRKAHRITGEITAYCLDSEKNLADLGLKEFRRFSKLIDNDVFNYISLDTSINRKASYGGTSKKMVLQQIERARNRK